MKPPLHELFRRLHRGDALSPLIALLLGLAGCQHVPHLAAHAPTSPVLPEAVVAETEVQPQAPAPEPIEHQERPSTGDLWERIRRGMPIAPLRGAAAQRMAAQVRWYQARMNTTLRILARGQPYLFDIVEAVEREGMPMELALLPAVESAFVPTARSPAQADGLWQFVEATARRFGLRLHHFHDDRRNLHAATAAALRYLKALNARYRGDWQLTLAAYNCGEGCIDAAIRRARASGLPGRYEDLILNDETAQYVPRLLALYALLSLPAPNGMSDLLPPLPNAPYLGVVAIDRDLDLILAARWANLPLQVFKALNPQHRTPLVVAAASPVLFIPLQNMATFESSMAAHRGATASWTAARVRKARSVTALALRHGLPAQVLRDANDIPAGHAVSAGSTLLVPRQSGDGDISQAVAQGAKLHTHPEWAWVTVRLGRKSNWTTLARRLKLPASDLQRWNPGVSLFESGRLALRVPHERASRGRA